MECSKKTYNRLKRCEGQMRGVINMLKEKRDCEDIVTQLCAVRASIDKIIAQVVTENLVVCMDNCHKKEEPFSENEIVKKAVNLLIKSR